MWPPGHVLQPQTHSGLVSLLNYCLLDTVEPT